MGDELDIKREDDGAKVVLTLSGNLSTISSPYLAEAVKALPDSVTEVEIDIADIDYISDAGFEVLKALDDELSTRGASLVILHPSELVEMIIVELDMEDAFNIVK